MEVALKNTKFDPYPMLKHFFKLDCNDISCILMRGLRISLVILKLNFIKNGNWNIKTKNN